MSQAAKKMTPVAMPSHPVAMASCPVAMRTPDGAEARVEGHTLTVRAPGGEVIFTWSHGVATARAAELSIEATDVVKIAAPNVELAAGDQTISLNERGLTVKLDEARVMAKDTIFAAERIETIAEKARHVVGVVEVRATRIVEHAKDVYREATGLSQTRAERIRTVAKGAFQLLANRATIKAEDDLSLMGEKIHLS
jgi:hypothetical protein